MKSRYLVIIAVVVFLLFVVRSAYLVLCPPHWSVECFVTDGTGKVVSSRLSPKLTMEHQVKEFTAGPERDGERCTAFVVRECLWGY
jgi:hypothetical protein